MREGELEGGEGGWLRSVNLMKLLAMGWITAYSYDIPLTIFSIYLKL